MTSEISATDGGEISNKEHAKARKRSAVKIFFFFALTCLLFVTVWAIRTYDNLNLAEIVFHLYVPLQGTGSGLVSDAVFWTLLPAFIVTSLFALAVWPYREQAKIPIFLSKIRLKKHLAKIMVALLILLEIFLVQHYLGAYQYIEAQFTYTNFIEENYVDLDLAKIKAPAKKRNLIFLFLESMESTYMDSETGGVMQENKIKRLSKLAEENLNFSHSEKLGGFRNSSGTSWTVGACFGATTGLPLKVPPNSKSFLKTGGFFPGVTSLGDILKADGYTNVLMMGTDSTFGGQGLYYQQHGEHLLADYNWAVREGHIPKDYFKFWGMEDHKLYELARKELLRLAQEDQPFALTMFTIDTHFEDGFLCDYCPDTFSDQYSNVIACADKQASDFVDWLKEQDFYEDTTIIIAGDHLTMHNSYLIGIERDERSVYNCFINAAANPGKTKKREFMAMDLFPTTLAALGYEIEGDRLGLGTNLFSAQETLVEKYGVEEFDNLLMDRSRFYEAKFIYNED